MTIHLSGTIPALLYYAGDRRCAMSCSRDCESIHNPDIQVAMQVGGKRVWAIACALLPAVWGCGDNIECKDPDQYGVVLSGDKAASSSVTREFWMAHLEEIHAIAGLQQSGVSECCEGWHGASSECLSLGVLWRYSGRVD
jgi:hypothetical protein